MPPSAPEDALDEVWGALRTHHPMLEYLGVVGENWHAEYLPRVRAAGELAAALPIIEELVLRLQECHTRLLWPGKPAPARPDVRLGWVEGGLAVIRGDAGGALRPGDRVLGLDGTAAEDAVRAAWPRAQGATAEGHLQSACDRAIEGPPGTTLRLETERGACALPRGGATAARPEPVVLRVLPGSDAAVLRVPRWWGDGLLDQLDAFLEEARDLPHLVVDVRGNGGGYDAPARALVGRFTEAAFVCSIALYREAGTETFRREVAVCHPRGPWRYAGRVAVLTDTDCRSACVHFAAAAEASGAACLVGAPTDGGCGLMQHIPLRCGATLVCSRTFPIDGGSGGLPSPLHGTPPHIPVPPTLAALRAGRDGPLEAALAWLRSGAPVPRRRRDPLRPFLPGAVL